MITRFLTIMTLLFVAVTFVDCGSDDPKPVEPTAKEKVTATLTAGTGTWSPAGAAGITVDGVDVTADLFPGFSIKFAANNTFTTTGESPVWSRVDTWQFTDDTATAFTRGQDGKVVTITSISDTQLTLTLEWDQLTFDPPNGRATSIPGTYTFVLNK